MRKPLLWPAFILVLILLINTGCQSQANISRTFSGSDTLSVTKINSVPVKSPIDNKNGWKNITGREYIRGLLTDGDVLWVFTAGGVERWEPKTGNNWKYTTLDGLASNMVYCALKDDQDNLWFGTDQGLTKYDGNTWNTLTTANGMVTNLVTDIVQDKQGCLWVGWSSVFPGGGDVAMSSGIGRYDGVKWKTYTTQDGLVSDYIHTLFCDAQGNIWAGGGDGLAKFDGKNWSVFTTKNGLPNNAISSICQDKQGNIWVGTWGGGAGRFNGKHWDTFRQDSGLGNMNIADITADSEGKIWFAHNLGVTRYDGKSWSHYGNQDGLPGDSVSFIAGGNNDCVWCSTYELDSNYSYKTTGIGYYNGNTWQGFEYSGLTGNNLQEITIDGSGNIWYEVSGKGIGYYDGVNFRFFTNEDGLQFSNTGDIVTDKNGNLWFSIGGVVFRYSEGRWIPGTIDGELAGGINNVLSRDSEGNIWLVNSGGIGWYNGTSWHTLTGTVGLPKNNWRLIYHDSMGNIWLADWNHLWRFDGARWDSFSEQFGSNAITSITSDNHGHIWVAVNKSYVKDMRMLSSGAVLCFDGQSWSTFITGPFIISSIYQDSEGTLWFCTSNGLVSYDGINQRTYGTNDGLVNNDTRAIVENNRVYWIATAGGISRFDSNNIK